MRRDARLYLKDIEISIKKIEGYTKTLKFNTFVKDEKTIDAVVRNLSIIGEAARNMPKDLRLKNPDVPWSEIIGMRNKVVHEYFGIDEQILWKTIKEDIPLLKKKIKKIK